MSGKEVPCLICRRPEYEHRDRNGHGFFPTPVPSEADPGTGEREPGHCTRSDLHEPHAWAAGSRWCPGRAPIAPGAEVGDCRYNPGQKCTVRDHWPDGRWMTDDDLASHDADTADRVRRETAEGIAAAIEEAGRRKPRDSQWMWAGDAAVAARIAREAGR